MGFSTVGLQEHNRIPKTKNIAPRTASGCSVCAKICAFFVPTQGHVEVSMGKVAFLLEGDCPHVNYFKNVKYMYGSVPDYEEQELSLHRWQHGTGVSFSCSYKTEKASYFSNSATMELVFKEEVPGHPGRILLLDPQWINQEVGRGWISDCDKIHGKRCKSLPLFEEEDNIRPLYLVDTLQNCLVQGKDVSTGYVALSYMWGKTEILRNNMTLCQRLQQPGVLASGELARCIPQTLKDAFAIARCLGQRHLWVDALCILQDDTGHLHAELSQMHRIYACASFTIIAADGANANYGLRGFKGLTLPRSLRQEPVQLGASEQIMQDVKSQRHGNIETSPQTPAYYNRAWAFQERLFSKRKLIFEKESIRWQCQCSDWYEELLPRDKDDERFIDYTEHWFHSPVPTLSNLSSIIMEYNQKIHTFREDAFSAFAGIQAMLHRTYPSGLIYGHPELFFDIALNWRPIQPVNRRKMPAKVRSDLFPHQLPSWSWIGWAGKLTFPFDHESTTESTGVVDIEGYMMPVTKWYAIESPLSKERRRINSSWHTYKLLARDETLSLPPGWRRERYDIKTGYHLNHNYMQHYFPREIPKACYKHSSFRDETQLHWYPVPTLEHGSLNPTQLQTAFLYAQTSRAFLYAGNAIEIEDVVENEKYFPPAPPQIQLINGQGQHVGHLRLNNKEDLAYLGIKSDPSPRRLVELVATCKGYTGNIFDYELAKAMAKESGSESWAPQLKDCYFVLWIEWDDGVAYRKGAGAVTVDAWETEKEAELVDLILG